MNRITRNWLSGIVGWVDGWTDGQGNLSSNDQNVLHPLLKAFEQIFQHLRSNNLPPIFLLLIRNVTEEVSVTGSSKFVIFPRVLVTQAKRMYSRDEPMLSFSTKAMNPVLCGLTRSNQPNWSKQYTHKKSRSQCYNLIKYT